MPCVLSLALRKSVAACLLMSKWLSQDPSHHLSLRGLSLYPGRTIFIRACGSVTAVQRHLVGRSERRDVLEGVERISVELKV